MDQMLNFLKNNDVQHNLQEITEFELCRTLENQSLLLRKLYFKSIKFPKYDFSNDFETSEPILIVRKLPYFKSSKFSKFKIYASSNNNNIDNNNIDNNNIDNNNIDV